MRSCRCLAAAALAAALAASVAPARAADLVLWHSYRADERAALEKVVAGYNARQGAGKPRVTTVAIPFDAFADKVTAAVPRGKGPDLFIYPQDRLGGWIEAGRTVEPIDFFLDAPTRARFIPTTLQAMTYRGNVYGLPLDYKLITLAYNRKLVKAPPRTTAELAALCAKLTRRDAGVYGLAYEYGNFYYHAALMNGFGGRVFDPAMRPVLDSPENARALQLLLRWKDAFLPPEPSAPLILTLFNEGKAAMIFTGPWNLGELSPAIDYGLAPLPTLSEAHDQPMRPWMTVEGLFVTAPSAQKEAAYAFARYVTDLEAARTLAIEGHQLPAVSRLYADPAVAKDEHLQAFFRQVKLAVPMPNAPEMTMMWAHTMHAMSDVLRRAATPEAALAKAQAAVAGDVAKLRRKP